MTPFWGFEPTNFCIGGWRDDRCMCQATRAFRRRFVVVEIVEISDTPSNNCHFSFKASKPVITFRLAPFANICRLVAANFRREYRCHVNECRLFPRAIHKMMYDSHTYMRMCNKLCMWPSTYSFEFICIKLPNWKILILSTVFDPILTTPSGLAIS
jgi:hypothetical protein